jgi:hypothetical protein
MGVYRRAAHGDLDAAGNALYPAATLFTRSSQVGAPAVSSGRGAGIDGENLIQSTYITPPSLRHW